MVDLQKVDPQVASFLSTIETNFEVVEIDPDLADTADFCREYNYPLDQAANTLVVASKRGPKVFSCCVVLATTRLDVNRRVKGLMEVSRVSFASAEQMAELTGMKVGGVTPFGIPLDVPMYVDSRVMACDWIILGSGNRDAKIKIDPAVFGEIPNAQVIENLAMEIEV
jgi:prolyl-tRNA editing enzyme YbaK/EbsC (Cys-tRNA(Pro) deacylase)